MKTSSRELSDCMKIELKNRKSKLEDILDKNKNYGFNYNIKKGRRNYNFNMTQKYKFEILLKEENSKESKYKSKKDRHKRYKVAYYLMSKFVHNSIDFMQFYKPQKNKDAYSHIIASILKNGVHYLSDIYGVLIGDEEFKELSSFMKEIKKSGFNVEYNAFALSSLADEDF